MKSSCSQLLMLSCIIAVFASSRAENITLNTTNLDQVECSANQEGFVAQTELILEGSNEFFDNVELNALQTAFLEIYNKITRDSCDSYFRRLNELTFVSMTNQLNETITSNDMELLSMLDGSGPGGGPSQNTTTALPEENLPDGTPLSDEAPPVDDTSAPLPDEEPEGVPSPPESVPEEPPLSPPPGPPPDPFRRLRRRQQEVTNSTSDADDGGVSTVFNVTGTCRDCAVSRSGSFALFDDSFRLRIRFRVLSIAQRELETPPGGFPGDNSAPVDDPPSDGILEDGLSLQSDDVNDCTCATGSKPLSPQAPPVPQLLEFLNQRLVELEEEQGIFKDIVITDLTQLDDLEEDDVPEGVNFRN